MQETNNPKWLTLLNEALTKPGMISEAYSRFWNYSLGNQIAAMMQCWARGIKPGPLATYPAWQRLGRQVRKGEKAIELCQPIMRKKEKKDGEAEETKAETIRFFLWRKAWFVLSQTDGPDLPPATIPAWDKARALEALNVREIPFDLTDGNCQGYARKREVAVSPIAVYPHKTLFHELAHVLLGHTEENKSLTDAESTPKSLREVEAESVAMLVGDALGLVNAETLTLSRGYIQSWAHGIESIPERSAQKIFHAADQIIRAGRPPIAPSEAN